MLNNSILRFNAHSRTQYCTIDCTMHSKLIKIRTNHRLILLYYSIRTSTSSFLLTPGHASAHLVCEFRYGKRLSTALMRLLLLHTGKRKERCAVNERIVLGAVIWSAAMVSSRVPRRRDVWKRALSAAGPTPARLHACGSIFSLYISRPKPWEFFAPRFCFLSFFLLLSLLPATSSHSLISVTSSLSFRFTLRGTR